MSPRPASTAGSPSGMADGRRSRASRRAAADTAGSLLETWRRLNTEQRVAAVASLLLIASTFGPFSFVEAAVVLTAAGVLALLKQRGDRRPFHLPFGDGTVILAAGAWSALLIVVRLFDRPLGQSVLALACAAILAGAGARERAKRPADDLPLPPPPPRPHDEALVEPRGRPPGSDVGATARIEAADDATEPLRRRDEPTERKVARRPVRTPPPERPDPDGPPRPAERQ